MSMPLARHASRPSHADQGSLNALASALHAGGLLAGDVLTTQPSGRGALAAHVARVRSAALGCGLVRLSNVARQLERLLTSEQAWTSPEALALVCRAFDVMTLLARDAERQQAGRPAAALDEVVHGLQEAVERICGGTVTQRPVVIRLADVRDWSRRVFTS